MAIAGNSRNLPPLQRVVLAVLGVLLVLAGLFLGGGGGYLAVLGGTWYFLLAGLALIASGVQILCASSLRAP